jgi:hydroxymethylbilane synthase
MSLAFRLGTRRSPLALAQARQVRAALQELHADLTVELVPITTAGDRLRGSLADRGGKGLFTVELEEALGSGRLDLAVHSLKDLPERLPPGLKIAAFPERADPRDVLITTAACGLAELPAGSVVLTGALRRQAQLLHLRPDLRVEPVRGNVETRLRRWRESGAAAIVLAAAGLDRLGLGEVPAQPFDPQDFVPAPGQGTLAVQVRAGSAAEVYCRGLDHPPTARAAAAERGVVGALGGDCALPLAAWARPAGSGAALRLTGLVATPDGRRLARAEVEGLDPAALAGDCAAALRAEGADEILRAARQ